MTHDTIVPIVMPKWGLSMQEGRVNEWLVADGADIAVGDEILEVETDKIAGAVEAPDAGVLRRRVAQAGEVYPVKALLGVLADSSVSDGAIDAFVSAYEVPAADEGEEESGGPSYQFIDVAGRRLRYAVQGDGGSAVLLVHGFGGDLDNWLFNIGALAEAHTVYALDLPGHGQSEKHLPDPGLDAIADTVLGFVDALGIEKAHWIGHSMGGAVALLAVSRQPSRAASVALLCTLGLGREINGTYIRGFVEAQSRRELKPYLAQLFSDPNLVTRQLVDDVLKFKRLDGVQSALSALAQTLATGDEQQRLLHEQLAGLDVPVLVVWGKEDQVIPANHAEAASGKAHVEVVDGAGHMVQMEKAGAVNRLLLAHIAGS